MSATTYACTLHNWIGCLTPCPMCVMTAPAPIQRATHPTPCQRCPVRAELVAERDAATRKVERLRTALGRANDRVDNFLASAPSSPDSSERLLLRDLQETAEWYVRCLDDVRAHRPVRGLDEAEAAYSSADKRAREALRASSPEPDTVVERGAVA